MAETLFPRLLIFKILSRNTSKVFCAVYQPKAVLFIKNDTNLKLSQMTTLNKKMLCYDATPIMISNFIIYHWCNKSQLLITQMIKLAYFQLFLE